MKLTRNSLDALKFIASLHSAFNSVRRWIFAIFCALSFCFVLSVRTSYVFLCCFSFSFLCVGLFILSERLCTAQIFLFIYFVWIVGFFPDLAHVRNKNKNHFNVSNEEGEK